MTGRNTKQKLAEFRRHWKHYIIQSFLAALALFGALWLVRLAASELMRESAVIVGSIGSTAFIVFILPSAPTARPLNVVGGQTVGVLCGALGSVAATAAPSVEIGCYSAAVALSILVMAVTDTEHPPAAGTALGVAVLGASWPIALVAVGGAVLLSICHRLLRPWLRDLL